jgi:PKD repeat protein/N-acetylneuraminic acid mutarotase
MPTATSGAAFGVIGGKVLLAGGQVANNCAPTQTLRIYDPASDTWTTGAPMPTARWYGAAGVLNGLLYVVGGEGGGCPGPTFHTVEAYDPVTNTWLTKAPMPTARYYLGVGVVDGILYTVGGADHSGIFHTVEAYDPVANTWTTKAPMPTARYALTVAVADGILYAIGGDDCCSQTATVEAYNPVTNTWTTRASLPMALANALGGVVQGTIYVAGGTTGLAFVNTLQQYDPATDTWTSLSPMTTARIDLMGGLVNDTFYAMGGDQPGPTFLATNEAFTPPAPPSCEPAPSGLVSWWPGEGNAHDIVGPNDGTPLGGVSFAAGEVGQAFAMDGRQATGGIDVGNAPSLHFSAGDFSIEAWVRFDAALYDRSILSKMTSTAGIPNTDGWALIKQDNNHFWFCLGGGTTNGCGPAAYTVFSTTVVIPNVWYHLAVVKTASDFALYVNGLEEDRRTLPLFVNTDATDLLIGGGAQFLLNGEVDEVSIYGRALSAPEIQAIYSAGSAGKCAPPPIQPPTVSAGGPYTGSEGIGVAFDASGSSDPQGLPLSYDWDFGDGSPHGSGVAPTHVYVDNGSYPVTLSVTNTSQVVTTTTTATIANAPPTVDAGADASALTGQTFTVNARFTDPGLSDGPWTTSIDWGNGSAPTQGVLSTAGAVPGSKVYTGSGTYNVTVTVTDKDGGSGSDVVQVTVTGSNPPVISSVGGPYSGSEGTSIRVVGSAGDVDGDPLTYSWDFGDGSTPTIPSSSGAAIHTYADNGSYSAKLTVTDVHFSSTATAAVTIGNLPPIVDAGPDASLVTGQPLTLSASFSDPGTADAPWATSIDWGDGSPVTDGSANTQGTIAGVHAYLSYGTFTVTIRVTDKDGASGADAAQVTVINRPPVATAGGPYGGNEGATITVNGAGSSDPDGDALTYTWDFGDGSAPASGATASHTYADDGTYAVTLTVSDGHLMNSATTTASVLNVAPTATFNHPGTTKEGSKFTISLTNPLDPSPVDQAAGFTYAFDCGSGYGAFATSISVSCPTVDNGLIPIRAKLRDKDGGVREYTATQTVANVAPNVTLNAASSQKIRVGDSFTVTGSFTDVGVQDAAWTVIIDWGNGTTTTTASVQGSPIGQSRVYTVAGTYQVRMKVTDKDGGTGTSSSVTVKVQ